ncbi:type II toxin-antitoxin system VapC family toxin [Granulicella mallensis]|jgi:ribonuclease VapC|uniref:Ribonuclease VapC n=1 Tax=Granulicella mallensis (strain ATCC BAA-1857 / DSM 23137 / MP5ACTX8) TaxID=682795 RepID=G8NNV8_GRAMM|nr:type II toxin-antitoxin system VapC family toxin [Granulicella mallensis]AEU35983.1 PilT protein domain protein [Granulicella mallensis MP5ACTX8]
MVIDSSALVAILLAEPDASIYISAILNDVTRLISAATLVETSIVMIRRREPDAIAALDAVVARLQLTVIPVDREQALLARQGFRRFGKGLDRAGLNFGDCFSYALAMHLNEPLLFKGNDFTFTDVLRA